MKLEQLFKFIKGLTQECFWGEVLIKFENGEIKIVKKTENIKVG